MVDIIDGLSDDIYDFVIESDTDAEMDCKGYEYCILSIDIGVLHLGISVSLVDEEYNLLDIIWVDLINITKFIHHYGPSKVDCKLYHTKTFSDWLMHVFQENIFFEKADIILIERQPPMGFVAVEQLIFNKWRSKAVLISPNSMHKYLKINRFEYDKRKYHTELVAKMAITNPSLLEQLSYYHRCHDIADSICLMLYWLYKKKQELKEEERLEKIKEQGRRLRNDKSMSMIEKLDCFRFIPTVYAP